MGFIWSLICIDKLKLNAKDRDSMKFDIRKLRQRVQSQKVQEDINDEYQVDSKCYYVVYGNIGESFLDSFAYL